MAVTADLLRELHRMHQQLADLQERLQRGPRAIKAREAAVAKVEAALAQAQADLKAARMAADQKQLNLRTSEEKIKQLRAKLMAANSNREYQALQEQINADIMANSVLSDEILETLEKIEELKKTVQTAEAEVARVKEDLAKARAQVTEQLQSLQVEVTRVEVDLKTAEEALPADVKPEYSRAVRGRGCDGMAEVEANACGGCFQSLTPNVQSELRMGRLVFCKTCGRILYLPEDSQPAGRG